MTKTKMLIGGIVASILVLFFILCFVMSTINPDRIAIESEESDEKIVDSMLFDRYTEDNIDGSLTNTTEFEKMYENNQQFEDNMKNELSHTHKIIKEQAPGLYDLKNTDQNDNRTSSEIVKKCIMTVKGRRRSVNNDEHLREDDNGVVIVKIIDDDGNPRVEIKVNPHWERESQINKTNYAMFVQKNGSDIKIGELSNHPIIKIMKNSISLQDGDEDFLIHKEEVTNNSYTVATKEIEDDNVTSTTLAENTESTTDYLAIDNKTTQVTINDTFVTLQESTEHVEVEKETSAYNTVNFVNVVTEPTILDTGISTDYSSTDIIVKTQNDDDTTKESQIIVDEEMSNVNNASISEQV